MNMKRLCFLFVSLIWVCGASAGLRSESDKLSYTIGFDLGTNFKEHQKLVKIDLARLKDGIEDALQGRDPKLDKKEMAQSIQDFQKKLMAERQQQFMKQAESNKKEGVAFLAKNKKKKGVITTKSGLQYEIIQAGSGASPQDDDEVEVSYTGKTIDGTVFDTSDKRDGKTVRFKVSAVIPGWTEALKLMKKGAHYKVAVPSELGYGETGMGPIGPNQTLLFDIQLKSFSSTPDDKNSSS